MYAADAFFFFIAAIVCLDLCDIYHFVNCLLNHVKA